MDNHSDTGQRANGQRADGQRANGQRANGRQTTTEIREARDAPFTGLKRHPEKRVARSGPENMPRKPEWLRVKAPASPVYFATAQLLKARKLVTVCEEAACPNIGECWAKKHATFMIMGDICTRACAFCNVATGRPGTLDKDEPRRIAETVAEIGLNHVVITSVDRDDLEDGGAEHFVQTINAIRRAAPETSVEILTPDFRGKPGAFNLIINRAPPDVFNHNLETVPRLYPSIRPGSRYFTSLHLLQSVRQYSKTIFTKSGLMVGLGETDEEVFQVMDDLREADVDFLTIGQYLQPTRRHAPVKRFVPPDTFDRLAERARARGFLMVSASPLTRSSYHAGEDFLRLKAARLQKNGPQADASPEQVPA